jgi:hypothetical protein
MAICRILLASDLSFTCWQTFQEYEDEAARQWRKCCRGRLSAKSEFQNPKSEIVNAL